MDLVDAMLSELARPGVTEFAVSTGRLPCAKRDGTYQPIGLAAPSTQVVLEMLLTLGGASHIDFLGAQPIFWRARASTTTDVLVAALRRDDQVQARFSLASPLRVPPGQGGPPLELELDVGLATAPKSDPKTPGIPRLSRPIPTLPSPGQAARPDAGPPGSRPSIEPEFRLDVPSSETAVVDTVSVPVVAATDPLIVETEPPASEPTPTLEKLLELSRARGASDLHIIAGRPALLRVAGVLGPVGSALTPAAAESLLTGAVPDRLQAVLLDEGSCDFAIDTPRLGRFRVNVSRQRTGLKGSFRLIGREIPTLESLGLPREIARALEHHQGLIVLTGPTGHGKTTTLAALVDRINEETTHHVITVEDPVEYVHGRKRAMISQREVGTHTRSFASALKASLREDPDVIVVGELRDSETVRMALSASETGHLVIGTMNTPSAARTIDRLIDLFPPADQPQVRITLAAGLRLVVSQRLLPAVSRDRVVAAAEILPGSVALSTLIRDAKTYQIPSLQQRGKAHGIVRLDDSLAALVRAGSVTIDEACAYAEAPDELRAQVDRRGG